MKKKWIWVGIGLLLIVVLICVGLIWNTHMIALQSYNEPSKLVYDCTIMRYEIDPDSVNVSDGLSLVIKNVGGEHVNLHKIITYGDEEKECSLDPSYLGKGKTRTIKVSSDCIPLVEITKIRVATENCPGFYSEVEKIDDIWKLTK